MKKTTVFTISMLTSVLLLSGCAAPKPPAVDKLHNEVGKLNQQMRQLTAQATVLEQQNQLNSGAPQGAWLLPNANTAVLLQSNVGELRLSLSHVEAEANGTRALLHIRAAGEQPLVPLTALIEWGELDPITGKPLPADRQSQSIELPSSLLPKAETTISLRLSGIQPEQLGYVRVHDIVPQQITGK
ncbi:DUF3251 domain-containing protein [Erwiniaceae bacterium BAC15a-03b]|uniref:DUF3251 domain-containing protein n=1 Tax=Winslowiella arboricola TaxID=2978220 RepID=A0A9J6PN77_9GAMM|nr:DUF3251 domain-containing protein [Winslowiella arboricola]MCU5772036.1 DUF3251 domain-containing protein [Winslowiella arboricola]MCU5776108.1 DUF3251 domain-containing protein [Winslowiella arboricola]